MLVDRADSGDLVLKNDTGKLEGEPEGGERTGLLHVQVLLEGLRIGSQGTQKHWFWPVNVAEGRSYEVTGLILA